MMVSQNLIKEITRNANCFNSKNLTHWFTTDPFSATNTLRSSDAGFSAKNATGVILPRGRKAEAGSVVVVRSSLQYRKVRKGGDRAAAANISQKATSSAKATGFKRAALTQRGARLHRVHLRTARLDKQTK